MKLIRWLLSNIILIAFVLALTYAYVYWDNLTGEETPLGKAIAYLSVEYDEVSEFLDSYDFGDSGADRPGEAKVVAEVTESASVPQAMAPARTQPPAPRSPQPSAPPQGSMQPPAMAGQPSSPPVTWRQQPPPAPAPAVRQPPVQMAPVQTRSPAPGSRLPSAPPQGSMQPPAMAGQPSSPPVSWRQQPPPARDTRPPAPAPAIRQPPVQAPRQVPPTAMIQQPPATQPEPQVEAPPAGKPAEPVAATETAPQLDVRKLWISAREEYHRGNIDQSISHYRQVIANSENNYDAYGELGNVYLSRGKYREAADAYFQAASILAQQGQSRRAMSLLPMLERLDRSRAEELNQLLRAPQG